MMTAQQAADMSHNIHISEEFRFIFFNNPKAGCSTTKATLNLACASRLGVELKYTGMPDIHARAHNILKSPKQIGMKQFLQIVDDPSFVKFCVLREPASRISSAYANKFGGNSPQQRRLNEFLQRPIDYRWPDINEFVSAVASDNSVRDLDPHWRLQYLQVGARDIDMTLVGFQEELDTSLRRFGELVFNDPNMEIFDARLHFPQNLSKSQKSRKSLSEHSLELLRKAYAEDFAFYRREWDRAHGDSIDTQDNGSDLPS